MSGGDIAGLLIRQARLGRDWSQAGLCRGICAPSYLSKIEQGKAAPSPEVTELLLRRLGLDWTSEPESLEPCWKALLSGSPDFVSCYERLVQPRQESLACGPLAADALLLATPYYNKTSQAGLVAHFTAMAEAGGIPVILYNVPSRTGLNIAPETAKELSKHPLINGIKEASGNIGQVAKIAALCGDELNIYSGNDDQVVPLLALGGKGVISVVSNVKPELVHNCCKAFFDGDTAKARQLQLEMLPLADALFCEVNPIPVKYAMNVLGWEAGECRLPLVEPSEAHKEQIEKALRAEGLITE